MTTATASQVGIKPLEDRIVVQVVEAEQTTASGLVIPDTAKEKPQEGRVLAVGPGRFDNGVRIPLDVAGIGATAYVQYAYYANGWHYSRLDTTTVSVVVDDIAWDTPVW